MYEHNVYSKRRNEGWAERRKRWENAAPPAPAPEPIEPAPKA